MVRRFAVGNIECLSVSDGTMPFRVRSFFVNAPDAALFDALKQHHITGAYLETPFFCLLLRLDGQIVMIDTGMGPTGRPTAGHLLANLRAEGIPPDAINWVILSHAHLDHIGGALDEARNPAFPNARYVLSAEEWSFWFDDSTLPQHQQRAEAIRADLLRLRPQLTLIPAGSIILPGLTSIHAPGHTPGQIALLLESRGQQLLYTADMVAHPIHLDHIDWNIIADTHPEQAIETRRALLQRARAENMQLFGYHFPIDPCFSGASL